MFKRDCDIFTFFTLLYALLCHIIKKGEGRIFKRPLEYKPPYAWGGGGSLTSIHPRI